jgi:nucleoside-diphosphate-sugar epimerase
MKCVVTGAAGFIGSHLCDRLLTLGHEVRGLDGFIPYYPEGVKERNLATARNYAAFRFQRLDLRRDRLDELVADAEVVFHLAAMPGLERSWTEFDDYVSCNVQATQRLVEALRRGGKGLRRLVYGSTSSVYGRFSSGDEQLPTKPISPYGVTKLAAEQLCRAYGDAYGLPVVILRYFSVYGPRQRPDMAYHRFMTALLHDRPIVVYGDGQQVRGNTYVEDCVAATLTAVEAPPGEVYNVGGGETATVWEIVRKIETLAGRRANVRQEPARPGDQRQTFADTTKLRNHFGWRPGTGLDEGLKNQWDWHRRDAQEVTPG